MSRVGRRGPRLAIASIWVFAASIVVLLPGGMDRWVLPKLGFVAVAVAVAAFAPARGRIPRWLAVAGAILAVLLLIAALVGAQPIAQLWGRWPRYEGLIALPVYAGAIWAGARLLGPGETGAEERRRHLVSSLSVAAGLIAFFGLLEAAGARPIPSDLERPGSLLGNASDQGLVGAVLAGVLLPLVLGEWRRSRRLPIVGVLGVLAAVAATILSASRGALLALAVVALAVAVREVLAARHRGRAIGIGSAVLAVGVGLAFAVPFTRERLLGLDDLAVQTVTDRWELWTATLRMLAASPWVGVGPSGFVDAFPGVLPADWYARTGAGVVTDSPHGWPFQVLAAGGILAAVVLLVALVWGIVQAVRSLRVAAGGRGDLLVGAVLGIAAGAVALLTHFTIASTAPLLGLLGGALLAVPLATPGPAGARGPDPEWVRRVWGWVLAAWAAFLLVAASAEIPLERAIEAAATGDVAGAEQAFDAAAAIRPWDADVPLIAAEAFAGAAEHQVPAAAAAAQVRASEALARLPDSLRALKALAVADQWAGDVPGAISALVRAEGLSPNDPQVVQRRGVLRLASGDLVGARADLLRAAELVPDDALVWRAVAELARQAGDSELAAQAARRIAALGG